MQGIAICLPWLPRLPPRYHRRCEAGAAPPEQQWCLARRSAGGRPRHSDQALLSLLCPGERPPVLVLPVWGALGVCRGQSSLRGSKTCPKALTALGSNAYSAQPQETPGPIPPARRRLPPRAPFPICCHCMLYCQGTHSHRHAQIVGLREGCLSSVHSYLPNVQCGVS